MHFLYSIVAGLAGLLGAPWWIWACLRHAKYRAGLRERLGRVPERLAAPHPPAGCLWVHAVSVGEVLAVSELVNELKRRIPERRVLVSTTTATGQKLARARFGEENVFFFPLDFRFAIRPYLRALRPELIVLAETEFWPNFLQLAQRCGASVAVVNARISDRSFPRYYRARGLMARVLRNVDLFLAQSEEDARRLLAIGAEAGRVQIAGNLKFDVKPPQQLPMVAVLRAALARGGGSPVIVAGSTVEGEEQAVLDAFRALRQTKPEAVLVLAPRHPERFSAVAELLAASGLPCWRRSQWNPQEPVGGGVFLLDSIGELGSVYGLADLAFVGGSLAPRGGHNILEPAVQGVPVLSGPHTENFRDIADRFRAAGALQTVEDTAALTAALLRLTADPAEGRAMVRRAAELLQQHAGATACSASQLQKLLESRQSSEREPLWR
jgi:3-deoxy-D-manno-octulosonic-acid transferase